MHTLTHTFHTSVTELPLYLYHSTTGHDTTSTQPNSPLSPTRAAPSHSLVASHFISQCRGKSCTTHTPPGGAAGAPRTRLLHYQPRRILVYKNSIVLVTEPKTLRHQRGNEFHVVLCGSPYVGELEVIYYSKLCWESTQAQSGRTRSKNTTWGSVS